MLADKPVCSPFNQPSELTLGPESMTRRIPLLTGQLFVGASSGSALSRLSVFNVQRDPIRRAFSLEKSRFVFHPGSRCPEPEESRSRFAAKPAHASRRRIAQWGKIRRQIPVADGMEAFRDLSNAYSGFCKCPSVPKACRHPKASSLARHHFRPTHERRVNSLERSATPFGLARNVLSVWFRMETSLRVR